MAVQTCTTTDYILVPEEAQDKVVAAFSDVYVASPYDLTNPHFMRDHQD